MKILSGVIVGASIACAPTHAFTFRPSSQPTNSPRPANGGIQNLLGSADARAAMEAASTWSDEIKFQRLDTRPWRYVDIEIGTRG